MMLIRYVLASLGLRGTPRQQFGATLIEYALIVGLLAVVLIGAITTLEGGISSLFGRAATAVSGAGAD